ncbi:flagellar biosynthetic protein FliO [Salirhabdus sp. Marseille-P4669]|uniref:flagellar biosynthetic protein FliO n=1 Tax=Salirhabdus sp. Marseille-P4669 TaxID=2042310 RepID=UPI00135C1604|nr:flagellar biosynthetic protein FliO [Salirhabdus sp. Marseille-P4669]
MKKYTLTLLQLILLTSVLFFVTDTVYATNNSVSDLFDEEKSQKGDEETPATESEPEDELQEELASNNDSLLFDLIKMFFMLGIVLGLIYFLLKFLQKRNKMFQQVRAMENLGGISLGSNKSIQMVKIGSKVYVIGVGNDVNMLTEIDDPKFIEELENKEQNPSQLNASFQSLFQQLRNNKGKQPNKQNESTIHSFKQLFNDELKTMKQERKNIINHNNPERKGDQNE